MSKACNLVLFGVCCNCLETYGKSEQGCPMHEPTGVLRRSPAETDAGVPCVHATEATDVGQRSRAATRLYVQKLRSLADGVLVSMTEQDIKVLVSYVNKLLADYTKLEQRVLDLEEQLGPISVPTAWRPIEERLELGRIQFMKIGERLDDLEYASDNDISVCDVPIERDGVPAEEK